MKIEVIQGDTSKTYKFQRKSGDKIIETLPQKMWITFKTNSWFDEALFQKTLENGGITYSETDNYYRFQLKSDDTCDLDYGTYGFDIALLNETGEKKTLVKDGVLEITSHYTKKCNEV